MPIVGDVLADRYRLEAVLGVGGMASVYRATDLRLDRRVAVKVLVATLAADPRFAERFDREAGAMAGFSHPNVAAVYDVEAGDPATGREPFYVMEYCEGGSLAADPPRLDARDRAVPGPGARRGRYTEHCQRRLRPRRDRLPGPYRPVSATREWVRVDGRRSGRPRPPGLGGSAGSRTRVRRGRRACARPGPRSPADAQRARRDARHRGRGLGRRQAEPRRGRRDRFDQGHAVRDGHGGADARRARSGRADAGARRGRSAARSAAARPGAVGCTAAGAEPVGTRSLEVGHASSRAGAVDGRAIPGRIGARRRARGPGRLRPVPPPRRELEPDRSVGVGDGARLVGLLGNARGPAVRIAPCQPRRDRRRPRRRG
ncbi:MAG: protein kinase [Chloroflexi bacterium]|nr:protein kinase [Chloroflexota bacterium]